MSVSKIYFWMMEFWNIIIIVIIIIIIIIIIVVVVVESFKLELSAAVIFCTNHVSSSY
jgi:hypothetical protein